MIVFPNCKINLGLHITGKRSDGYHNLETVFYPLQLQDALETISADEFQWQQTGIEIPGNFSENLIYKAWQLLKNDFPAIPNLSVHLHKIIPMGAGLGGGSSNGAFMLTLLNKKFNLNLSNEQLIEYALHLGSDCPFFIVNKPSFATGRGEVLEEISLGLSAYKILLINPGIHISTQEAFASLVLSTSKKSVKEIIHQPIFTWQTELKNDFESSVFPKYPHIKKIKEKLYENGALYASMTGTGSTVFGLFEKSSDVELKNFPEQFCRWV
jgi:4-diphosphocytidyl-2-C-methyl-D-erythritol kinase